MRGSPATAAIEVHLRQCLARAGIAVPGDRFAAMLTSYTELSGMLETLRQPRTAASEPANIYSLETITRSK